MGGCLLLLRFLMKLEEFRSLIESRSLQLHVCRLWWSSVFVVVGGERNPASLGLSFRVRGREVEGNPASLVVSFWVRDREREGKR